MRTYTWMLVWAALIAWSCHKDGGHLENSLQGYWELSSITTVTIAGMSRTNYPGGNGHILRFNRSAYASYGDGQLLERRLYSVEELSPTQQKESCLTQQEQKRFTHRIVLNSKKDFGPFSLQGDSLAISSLGIDNASLRVYKRIQIKRL